MLYSQCHSQWQGITCQQKHECCRAMWYVVWLRGKAKQQYVCGEPIDL